jgi:hypothetical protein
MFNYSTFEDFCDRQLARVQKVVRRQTRSERINTDLRREAVLGIDHEEGLTQHAWGPRREPDQDWGTE